jgi:hypothetical protein
MASILFASQYAVKVSASLFASNCLYVSLVEQPARMALPTKYAHAQFRAGFIKVAVMQSTLSMIGCGSAIVANYHAPDNKLLAIAALLASVIPYTYVFMMETNSYLLDPKCDVESVVTRDRLDYCGSIHSVRTVIGLAAMAIALYYY